MPPKKKGGKKKKKKGSADGELTIEDKYKKTVEEVDALKDQLVVRRELTRKSFTQNDIWKQKATEVENKLEEQEQNQLMASQDMTRQYKTMQREMSRQIDELSAELANKNTILKQTQLELENVKREKEDMERRKEEEIVKLTRSLDSMDLQYRVIVSEAFHSLKTQFDQANSEWESLEVDMQQENKDALKALGLYPVKI